MAHQQRYAAPRCYNCGLLFLSRCVFKPRWLASPTHTSLALDLAVYPVTSVSGKMPLNSFRCFFWVESCLASPWRYTRKNGAQCLSTCVATILHREHSPPLIEVVGVGELWILLGWVALDCLCHKSKRVDSDLLQDKVLVTHFLQLGSNSSSYHLPGSSGRDRTVNM